MKKSTNAKDASVPLLAFVGGAVAGILVGYVFFKNSSKPQRRGSNAKLTFAVDESDSGSLGYLPLPARRKRHSKSQRSVVFVELDTETKWDVLEKTMNVNLSKLKVDVFYHFGLSTENNLQQIFGDTGYVIMVGSPGRAEYVANQLLHFLNVPHPTGTKLVPIGKKDRYSLFKVGTIVVVSHGMGEPSCSICLHELTKILYYSGAKDFTYIRCGTSGGIGCKAGTVVCSSGVYNGKFEQVYELSAFGQKIARPTYFDPKIANEMAKCGEPVKTHLGQESKHFHQLFNHLEIPTLVAKTMSCTTFYEGQGRLDGAIAEGDEKTKMQFVKQCMDEYGIRHFEMEGSVFSAFTNHLKIPSAMCCVTLLDRLNGDQVDSTPAQLQAMTDNAIFVVLRYIYQKTRHLPKTCACKAVINTDRGIGDSNWQGFVGVDVDMDQGSQLSH